MATSQHVRSSAAAVLAAATATGTMFLGSAAPVPARQATARAGVPILMFHVIGDGRGERLPELCISQTSFRAQVDWLAAHGYHAVTLDAVYRHWSAGAPLPQKPIVFSFDDGYPGDVTSRCPCSAPAAGAASSTSRSTTLCRHGCAC
jgi:hypothetical protein